MHKSDWFTSIMRRTRLKKPNQLFTKYADKIIAKSLTVLPCAKILHQTDRPDQINFDDLPDSYVIKPNHASGYVVIVIGNQMYLGHTHAKEPYDRDKVRQMCHEWMKIKRYSRNQPWYHEIKPCIIIEEYLHITDEIRFYLIHRKIIMIEHEKASFNSEVQTCGWYNAKWKPIEIRCKWPIEYHESFVSSIKDVLDDISEKIENDPHNLFDYVRLDTYLIRESDDTVPQFYFSEWTFAPGGFKVPFQPDSVEILLGDILLHRDVTSHESVNLLSM